MEIKIGIHNVAREVTLNVDLTTTQIVEAYNKARSADSLLTLTDTTGRQMMIPASGIAYIDFAHDHPHPVGFGA